MLVKLIVILCWIIFFSFPNSTASYGRPSSVSFTIQSGRRVYFLEHVVVKMSLSLHGYTQGYDYQDLYDYLQWDSKQESPQKSLHLFNGRSSVKDERDLYDWLENQHTKRGDIKIELTSPQGTTSVLLPYRENDFVNKEGYDSWPFMTVHHWGESPVGTWTLDISFKSLQGYVSMSGLHITLYGTASTPISVSNIPLTCDSACARGCSGIGQQNCDSCRKFRIAESLMCIDNCPNNTIQHKTYCLTIPTQSTTDSNSKNKIAVSVSLPVVLSVFLVVAAIIAGYCLYYRKQQMRSTMSFTPLRQESEEV